VAAGPHKQGLRRDLFTYLPEASINKKDTGNSREEYHRAARGRKCKVDAPFFSSIEKINTRKKTGTTLHFSGLQPDRGHGRTPLYLCYFFPSLNGWKK